MTLKISNVVVTRINVTVLFVWRETGNTKCLWNIREMRGKCKLMGSYHSIESVWNCLSIVANIRLRYYLCRTFIFCHSTVN